MVSKKSNPNSKSAVSKISYDINYGDNDGVFYPFLTVPGENLPDGYVSTVFHQDEKSNPALLRARVFVNLTKNQFEVFDNSDFSDELWDAMEAEAQQNIEEVDLEFSCLSDSDEKVLLGQGSPVASETIFSQTLMRKVHKKLDAEELQISIPRRGVILIAPKDVDEEVMNRFLGYHLYLWSDANEETSERLCKDLFVVKNGVVENCIYLPDEFLSSELSYS